LVVLVLVGYPVVKWATNTGESPVIPTSPASPIPAAAQALLNQSFALYQAHKYEESIAAGKSLVKEYPKIADGWNNLAASYAALGKWDDAIQCSQEALKLDPGHQLAKGNLAYAQKAKATGALPSAAAPADSLQGLLNLSAEYYRQGKFPECIDAADKAIQLNAGSAEAFNNKGACYGSLGMFEEEIQAEQEALKLNPGNQLAKNNLAWAMEKKRVRDSVREKR
jgi:tetratricopeptide (TPR) repeat protein